MFLYYQSIIYIPVENTPCGTKTVVLDDSHNNGALYIMPLLLFTLIVAKHGEGRGNHVATPSIR